jgi:hypothetical protein
MLRDALESRLETLEQEITRLLKLSGECSDSEEQDNYLRLAQDLQREARELRREIDKHSPPAI